MALFIVPAASSTREDLIELLPLAREIAAAEEIPFSEAIHRAIEELQPLASYAQAWDAQSQAAARP